MLPCGGEHPLVLSHTHRDRVPDQKGFQSLPVLQLLKLHHIVQRAGNSTTNNSARCTACWQFYNTHLSTLYSVLAILQQTTQHVVQRAGNSTTHISAHCTACWQFYNKQLSTLYSVLTILQDKKKPFTYNVHQNSEYTQRYVVYGGHCTYTDYYLVPQTKT